MPRVTFLPLGREVEVPSGTSLLDAASQAGVSVLAPCGGEGTCGECLVRIESGSVESAARGCLSPEQTAEGWALACSSRVTGDVTIRVPEAAEAAGARIVSEAVDHAHAFLAPRGGQPCEPLVSRLCVRVAPPSIENAFSDLDRLAMALRPFAGKAGVTCGLPVLRGLAAAVRADAGGTVTVACREAQSPRGEVPVEIVRVEPGDTTARAFGLAIDIGTTTCAVHLVDLHRNCIRGTAADYNAQRIRGHDIISRINYAGAPARLDEMRRLVLGGLNALVETLCHDHAVQTCEIDSAAVVGNTTMVHLVLGLNPDYIRLEPYTPAVNRPPVLAGREAGLSMNHDAPVLFAPGVGSYVGGDITAGLLQTALRGESETVSLFLDIGTNGEVVIGTGEWLMACAASAGPAFEGYGVSCGTRAAGGAIERVRIDRATGRAIISVIGGGRPHGVCGSGMVDLLAELWTAGLLDASGRFNASAAPKRIAPSEESARNLLYTIVPAAESGTGADITISEHDVMNLMRAKAAIYSACSLMLRSVGLDFAAIDRVYVAGGFGRFLDLRRAIVIGMLPDLPLETYVYLGNSALAGAHALLTSHSARETITGVADRMTYLELNVDPAYMDEYTAALFIPHTDQARFPSVKR